MGRRVINGSFPGAHGLALSVLDRLPSPLVERVLFRSSGICLQFQKALQRLLGGPSSVRVQFTSGPLRDHTFECLTSEKYFVLGSNFEHAMQALLQQLVKPDNIVYDVGAHAGYMTLLLSALCGPGGQVFAFEPSPLNFARLKRNVELNKQSGVSLVNLAASDAENSVLLAEMGSYSCLVSESPRPGESYSEVRTIRLDDFAFRDGHPAPTLLKIDIEGHAGGCLKGATALLQETKPNVLCEIHHDKEFKGVREVLEMCSYRMTELDSPRRFPKHIFATPG